MMVDVNDGEVPGPRHDPMWEQLKERNFISPRETISSPDKTQNQHHTDHPNIITTSSKVYPSNLVNDPEAQIKSMLFNTAASPAIGGSRLNVGFVRDIYDDGADWGDAISRQEKNFLGSKSRSRSRSREMNPADANKEKDASDSTVDLAADYDALGSLPTPSRRY
jgi:hypothetical protein